MLTKTPSLNTFTSVLIIGGAGQTGQLFSKTISENWKIINIEVLVRLSQLKSFSKKNNAIKISSDLTDAIKSKPDVIILAVPNPADEILESLSALLSYSPVIILPQNGVEIAPRTQIIFEQKKKKVHLIRASLFSVSSLDENGRAVYNNEKLRIALAAVNSDELEIESLEKAKVLFEGAGFQVKLFDNYKSMEWTKLLVNSVGTSAVITGLTPRETFRDEKLFELEARAIKDRLEIMQAAGIPFADIPWQNISLLSQLRIVPINLLKKLRFQFAEIVSQGRNNQPPAAGRKIIEGRPTEIKSYLRPFIDQGALHGLKSNLDETILEIIQEHESGKINLAQMDSVKKKELLFEIYGKYLQKPFIPRSPIVTSIVQKITYFFCRELTIKGAEHLKIIRESLKEGKSVILLANHSSHADHPILVRMLQDAGYTDLAERIIFIAGMKFKDEIISRFLSDGYARVVISTPSTKPQTEEENRLAQQVNLKGFLKINKLLNQGNLLVLYAEGTRSRENKMLKAIPSVARYFENPNIKYLLPVGIQGTGEMLPVGRTIPRFAKATVKIGEPLAPSDVNKAVISMLPEEVKATILKDKSVRAMISEKTIDYVMRKIARLLPEQQRGYYS